MSTIIEQITAGAGELGLALARCIPRGQDRLLVEFRDQNGSVVAGQWHRDREVSARLAQRLGAAFPPSAVATVPALGLVIQRGGADRKLPVLAELVSREGASLVAHRAERRGVVRRPDGDYTKVVRPEKVAEVAANAATSAGTEAIHLPELLDVDHRRGLVATRALPGRTLEVRLTDPTVADADVAGDAATVGAAVRAFHEALPAAAGSAPHDADAEIAVARQWLVVAGHYGLVRAGWEAALDRAAEELAGDPTPFVRLHRDLHDKQLVMSPGEPVGMLDLDLTTSGEAALDIANLVTHFELRHLQGRCGRDRSARCAAAFLDGYRPDAATRRRIEGYAATTRLRLAAVYSFRDTRPRLIEQLLSAPHWSGGA